MKTLFASKEEFEATRKSLDDCRPRVRWNLGEPAEYPCVAVWHEWDNPNGPFEAEGEFVYVSDFPMTIS